MLANVSRRPCGNISANIEYRTVTNSYPQRLSSIRVKNILQPLALVENTRNKFFNN